MSDSFFIKSFSKTVVKIPSIGLSFLSWCEDALMHHLFFQWWIFVNFLISASCVHWNLLKTLWLTKSCIKHILVVAYHSHFSSESLVPVVLRLTENIIFLLERSSMGFSTFWIIIYWFVRSQIVVESSLESCWLVHVLKTTSTVWNVSVSTSSIVCVINWFGMNMSETISWSWFCHNKWS